MSNDNNKALAKALAAYEDDEARMWAVTNALGWSVDTDYEGQFIAYTGLQDPDYEDEDEDEAA